MPRSPIEKSILVFESQPLQELGGHSPILRENPSHYDHKEFSVKLFQQLLSGAKLGRLTLPRAFFGRSEIRSSSFRDTDLSATTAHWNDFIEIDFSKADLSRSDLRACVFEKVRFIGANLTGVDFRYCGFKNCNFKGADLTDAKFTLKVGQSLKLADEQKSVVDWQDEDGDEPPG